ncbi:MAG: HD-GYP domain-containing protein [Bacillota bacterium]
MRLVLTEDLKENMTLAKAIYDNGNILLNKGVENLYKYKDKLLAIGIKHLYVEDEYSRDIKVDEVIKEKTRRKGKAIIKKNFERIKKGVFNIDVEGFKSVVEDIQSELEMNEDVLLNLVDIKATSTYTYDHSVNVGVVCIALGKILNYSPDDLFKLGMGGMLHDVGKVLIPEKILNKPKSLTDYEYNVMKKHPQLGFEHLQQLETVSPLSRIVAYSHHERVNGSGYPRGLEGKDIHEFARIAAIADVFDALTSDRVYRDRWPTYRAAEYIMNNTETLFDYTFVKKFLRKISFYPNGSEVILSSGDRGIIAEQNIGFPTRPVVRIIKDKDGKKVMKELDLIKHLNIVVEKVII